MNRLTQSDIHKRVNTYNLAIDFDLRRPEEISERPDISMPGMKYINDSADTRETYYYKINPKKT